MKIDFTTFFKQYEELSALSAETFDKVNGEHAPLVNCRVGCDDCCYAIFDLSLIEALYINHHFNRTFQGEDRKRLLETANRIDRSLYKVKRKASQELNAGKNEDLILMEMAGVRMKCPLLNDESQCDLYDHRPITCRLYGVPTAIGGQSYTCGKSGFSEGQPYPTVNLDTIQRRLFEISSELIEAIKSKNVRMAEMVIPVSMALLTVFDETYLGLDDDGGEQEGDDKNKSG